MSAPIGVFDSGIGGLSILRSLQAALPHEDFVYFADTGHAPYGERGDAFVLERAATIARALIEEHGIKLLVVACNTATAAAIHEMRATWPGLCIVGVEPALKPAVHATRTRRIGVLATRGTLASAKFHRLQEGLSAHAHFVLQPCDGLAAAIEDADDPRIEALCRQYVAALGPLGGEEGQIDTVVLGCTHYPFVQPLLAHLAGPAVSMIETGEPVARQARRLLDEGRLLATGTQAGRLTLRTSGSPQALEAAAHRWLSPPPSGR